MPRDPFQRMVDRMEDVVRDIERRFPPGGGHVPVDVRERDGEIVVTAELPGIEKDMIDLRVDTDSVRISASDDVEMAEENERYVRRGRSTRQLRRRVALPAPVDPDTAEASYENGVLTVTVETSTDGSGRTVDIA